MSALERWQKRVDRYREERGRSGPPLWEREQNWYDRWVETNDYHSLLLPQLLNNLAIGGRVLEIGPGTGAFTIPLAEAGAAVLGLEPSGKMREKLRQNLAKNRLSGVEILPDKVETSLEVIQKRAAFQYALASFSLYNVREIDQVLEIVGACCTQLFILQGTGISSPLLRWITEKLDVKTPLRAPQLDLFYPLLLELGILADVRILWSSQNYLYDNEGSMLDSWQDKLELPSSRREDLALALSELTVHRNGQVGIFSRRPLALVTIEKQNQIQRNEKS